ncbi:citryl-CoA lyase [soil metagenome]
MSDRIQRPLRSTIARSTANSVHVFDLDLVDLLGKVSFGDFAYLELFRRLPSERESVLFNALLVTLVEHGITPSSLAARLTYLGAPESLQGAVAAGLLGLGSTFVGTIEGAARICQENLPNAGRHDETSTTVRLGDSEIDALAESTVARYAESKLSVPGFGHPVHKPVDPRAVRLLSLGRELGFDDSSSRLVESIGSQLSERSGKVIPLNATGAIGALASTLGVTWNVSRGLGVMARSVGLVGHILEERSDPMAATIWHRSEHEVSGRTPDFRVDAN